MEKPNIDPSKLDFSEFHPLDHSPGGRRRRQLPGGLRNHLHLAWTFKWSEQLRRATLCRMGRHHWCTGWTLRLGECRICSGCWQAREP
jgi:hypothetical protein